MTVFAGGARRRCSVSFYVFVLFRVSSLSCVVLCWIVLLFVPKTRRSRACRALWFLLRFGRCAVPRKPHGPSEIDAIANEVLRYADILIVAFQSLNQFFL